MLNSLAYKVSITWKERIRVNKAQTKHRILQTSRLAFRAWHKIYPNFLTSIVLIKTIQSVLPYFSIYFLGNLLSNMQHGKTFEVLLLPLILLLLSEALVMLLNSFLTRKYRLLSKKSTQMKNRSYTRKFAQVSLEDFECSDMHQYYARVRTREQGGFGIPRAKLMLEQCSEGLINLIAGMLTILSLRTFGTLNLSTTEKSMVLRVGLLTVLVVVLPLLGSFLKAKADAYWEKDPVTDDGNRQFQFCYRFAFNLKTALEVRLFRQDLIMLEETKKNTLYTPRGSLYHYAKGPMGIFNTLSLTVGELTVGLIYLFVFWSFQIDHADIGVIVSLIMTLILMSKAISSIAEGISISLYNKEAVQDTVSLLDMKEELREETETIDFDSIRIQNLSYSYPGVEDKALDNISLTLEAGKTYAVVGPNGSGKSTFIKILSGYYQGYEGKLFFNHNIPVTKSMLTSSTSGVFQDFGLVAGTVGENIACSRDYDRSKVEDALRISGITLAKEAYPQGIDTVLNKSFSKETRNVSGGEAQKLAIARALYQDHPIFLMDEPTAALDPVAEESIYQHLHAIVEGKTAFFVSHRLASCKFCEEILVFDKGKIVQRGQHAELLKEEGLYKKLWTAQANYYQH